MPKKTPKKPNDSSEYSPEHRYNVLLEEINGKLKQLFEGQDGLQNKVARMSERLERVEGKLEHVELEVAAIKFILKNDVATKKDLEEVKSAMATKKDLERFATKEEIKSLANALDKHLTAVESR